MKTLLSFILALSIAFALCITCVSLKTPEVGLIAEVTAQNLGYAIAKKNPTEAKVLLHQTQFFLDDLTQTDPGTVFSNWAKMVLTFAVKDPYLQMNFEKLLSLVEIDLKGKDPAQCFTAVQQVLKDFLTGLNAGLTS